MIKYIFPLFLLLFLTGCGQKNSTFSNKEPIYFQHLKYTKVSKILEDEDVKTVVKVTYLNSADPDKYDNEKQNFIISVYYTNEKDIVNYSFHLNEQQPLSIREIKQNDPIYKNIAMRNDWAEYYLFTFEDIEERGSFLLVFKDRHEETLNFSFKKE